MSYQQSHDELIDHLRRHVGFIRRSAAAYDAGNEDEAFRLAVTIRVLLHDTRNSSSLLTQLGLRDGMRYVDTVEPVIPNALYQSRGLVEMEVGPGGGRYVAPLDRLIPPRQNPPAPFDAWWHDPVTTDQRGEWFSRRSIVLAVANQDGGAHVDPTLDAAYAALSRENSLGWHSSPDIDSDTRRPFQGHAALSSVRQIAYELEATFAAELSNLLGGQP